MCAKLASLPSDPYEQHEYVPWFNNTIMNAPMSANYLLYGARWREGGPAVRAQMMGLSELARICDVPPKSVSMGDITGRFGANGTFAIINERKRPGEDAFSPASDSGFMRTYRYPEQTSVPLVKEEDRGLERFVITAPIFVGDDGFEMAETQSGSAVPIIVSEPYETGHLVSALSAYTTSLMEFAEFCSSEAMSLPFARVRSFDGSDVSIECDLAFDDGQIRTCLVGPMPLDVDPSMPVDVREVGDMFSRPMSASFDEVRNSGYVAAHDSQRTLRDSKFSTDLIDRFSSRIGMSDRIGSKIALSDLFSPLTFRDKSGQLWALGENSYWGENAVLGIETSPGELEIVADVDDVFGAESCESPGYFQWFSDIASFVANIPSIDAFSVPNKSNVKIGPHVSYDTVLAATNGMLVDVEVTGNSQTLGLDGGANVYWRATGQHKFGGTTLSFGRIAQAGRRAEEMLSTGEYAKDERGDYQHVSSAGKSMSTKLDDVPVDGLGHDGHDGGDGPR